MIAIIDYDAGNLTSVSRALFHINVENVITKDIKLIDSAQRIIFPGVGAAGSAMQSLIRLGLDDVIRRAIGSGKPVLGICLGTQIILQNSQENQAKCLGIIDGSVRAFSDIFASKKIKGLKIPHMGWNRIALKTDHPVFAGLKENDEFYFVHGYYPLPDNMSQVIATTDYGINFPSIIGMNNLVATQFHPEKSGNPGLTILKNFSKWEPC
ncbi:MAG: imidazole glycerol phosphate synthase subunit HisH [Desulfobacteraceae bacterium]|nr:imidazole glycerol phosphate synthase subunit HisH [Desulfobacteraceae bacterium]